MVQICGRKVKKLLIKQYKPGSRKRYHRVGTKNISMPDLIIPGMIIAHAGKSIPEGWELCDGREVNKNDARYAALYRQIGTTWGGNDNPIFRLPDLRGQFLMGALEMSEVGSSGGKSFHNHGGETSHAFAFPDGYYAPNGTGRSPQTTGLAHKHIINESSNLPPYKQIVFIIKL
jgi:Phage Tail Collar Domain